MYYKRFFPPSNLDRNRILATYKKKVKKRKKEYNVTRDEGREIIRELFNEIADSVVECEDGVVLKRIGYIANWKQPKKSLPYSKWFDFNFHTEGYTYHLSLFTDVVSNSVLTGWSMDRAFNDSLKNKVGRALLLGKEYKFKYTELKEAFNKKFNVF